MAKAAKKTEDTMDLSGSARKNLSKVSEILNREFGDGTIFGGEGGQVLPLTEPISTGDYGLDRALGIGGVPKGRIIEIYGPESGGKTTLALSIVREAIKAGGVALYVDAENAFDAAYAENMGISMDDLLISQPESGEQALMIVERALRTKAVDVIVVDSVAALTPQAELEGTMEDQQMGVQARMMGKGLRKINGFIKESNTLVIFINQLRMKIGVMFGNPETTPGGKSLPFYSSVRLDIRQKEKLTDSKTGDPTGIISKVKVVKNKVAPPFKVAEITISNGSNGEWGVSHIGSIFTSALELGLLEKSGAWISMPGRPEARAQGADNMKLLIGNDPELQRILEGKIEENMKVEIAKNRKSVVIEQGTLAGEDFYEGEDEDDAEEDFIPED